MEVLIYLRDKYYYGAPMDLRPFDDILTDIVKDLAIIYITLFIMFIIGYSVKNVFTVKRKLVAKATQTTFKKSSSTQTLSPHADTVYDRFGAMGEPNPF